MYNPALIFTDLKLKMANAKLNLYNNIFHKHDKGKNIFYLKYLIQINLC
jgi:hypothetical protein